MSFDQEDDQQDEAFAKRRAREAATLSAEKTCCPNPSCVGTQPNIEHVVFTQYRCRACNQTFASLGPEKKP